MGQELTTNAGGAVTLPEDNVAELRAAAESLYREIERDCGTDTLPVLPAPDLRKRMQARVAALVSVLRPIATSITDRERVTKVLGQFYGGYLNIKTDNPAMMVAAWTHKLEDYPAAAIEAACFDFEHGRVFDEHADGKMVRFTLDHAPSFPRFLQAVQERTNDLSSERAVMQRVLMVRHVRRGDVVQDPRVGQMLRDLADEMAGRAKKDADEDRATTKREAREARERSARIIREAAERRANATT